MIRALLRKIGLPVHRERPKGHDVVECPICQSGNTASCPDYQAAYGDGR